MFLEKLYWFLSFFIFYELYNYKSEIKLMNSKKISDTCNSIDFKKIEELLRIENPLSKTAIPNQRMFLS